MKNPRFSRTMLFSIIAFVSACSSFEDSSDALITDGINEVDAVVNINEADAPVNVVDEVDAPVDAVDEVDAPVDVVDEVDVPVDVVDEVDVPVDVNDGTDTLNDELIIGIDTNTLAPVGCQNVVIVNDFAYAACASGIEIVDLGSFQRSFLPIPADDITSDASLGVLFTQSGNTLQQFGLANPREPNLITTVSTNFSLFSGVSAANGILVVSAGSGRSNTQVYTYDATTMSLVISGIPLVDDQTGNPDVHLTATADGALAFYSEDLRRDSNWGIQIIEFDSSGNILDTPEVVVLAEGRFTGSFGIPFGPANFPTESEFLGDRLYVAHFAANGIQVIDRSAGDALSLIPLGYEPTNIATDGIELFVVSVERDTIDIINPITEAIVGTFSLPLEQPVAIAAATTRIAVADRTAGLIVAIR